jgi:hypothetical protein
MSSNVDNSSLSRAERAFQRMTLELQARCDRVREALATVGSDDVKARYKLGALVNEIQQDPDKYGKRGVSQLARALGYDKTLLYRHAKVAECWGLKDLSDLQRRKGATGLSVSFSQLQLIATSASSASAKKREKYIELVLAEGLSVRELKRRLKATTTPAIPQPSASPDATNALRGLRATIHSWTEGVALLEAEILPALGSGPPSLPLREKYRRALAEQEELLVRFGKLRERLTTWLDVPEGAEGDAVEARAAH